MEKKFVNNVADGVKHVIMMLLLVLLAQMAVIDNMKIAHVLQDFTMLAMKNALNVQNFAPLVKVNSIIVLVVQQILIEKDNIVNAQMDFMMLVSN